eukprot:TRINITY_DN56078_c0_g1_i1.p1 TRINITY_DN56078_c0_g1~~TRINITY_DN56078_c0_g1_i1.p1  ORF type:complete len:379 (+),score=56.04 TRINITY_DN56078_c0_g1_i1:96-1139(+)
MPNVSGTNEPRFSRTKLLGIDVITIRDNALIESVSALPEVVRVAAATESPDHLPWLFRWYFPKTRFYNPALRGWFLPFRASSDATYAPCRAFLDTTFAQVRDTSVHVKRTVELLTDTHHRPTDRQLSDVAISAIWTYIVPEDHAPIRDEYLAAASAQIGDLTDSFLPWKLLGSVRGTAAIYTYVDNVLRALGFRGTVSSNGADNDHDTAAASADKLPHAAVTDVAHVLFAMAKNAPPVLRRLAELRQDEDLNAVLCAVSPTESVARMVTSTSTLNGLLPDNAPAEPRKTMVLFAIGDVAKSTGDITFVFSGGPGQRECAARKVIEKYFRDVHTELLRREQMSTTTSS